MNTFLKIFIGFIVGVICTVGAFFIVGTAVSHSQYADDELKSSNLQYFELNTSKGDVILHTYMTKDSVKLLMGKPNSVDVFNGGYSGVHETWEYKGRNRYISEFTIKFLNGELESVSQRRE